MAKKEEVKGKQSKNAKVGATAANICAVCGNPDKPVLVVSGGKRRMVHACHEQF